MATENFIGIMTGTSADSLDGCIVSFDKEFQLHESMSIDISENYKSLIEDSIKKGFKDISESNELYKAEIALNNKSVELINNLLIKFKNDNLDQNTLLLKLLKGRNSDKSEIMQLDGNHLTPVSIGIKEKLLKSNFQSSLKYEKIDLIVDQVTHWKI